MSKYIAGVPVVLIFFVLALLIPILAGDFVIYRTITMRKPEVITQTKTVVVTPTPTATPSAAITPKTFSAPTGVLVKPTVVVSPVK